MKYLSFCFVLLSTILFSSCGEKKINLNSIVSLGDDYEHVKMNLDSDSYYKITQMSDTLIEVEGEPYFINTYWDSATLIFRDNKLHEIRLLRPFSQTSMTQIEELKAFMRENCGEGQSSYDPTIAIYGLQDENKEAKGAIMVKTGSYTDHLFLHLQFKD